MMRNNGVSGLWSLGVGLIAVVASSTPACSDPLVNVGSIQRQREQKEGGSGGDRSAQPVWSDAAVQGSGGSTGGGPSGGTGSAGCHTDSPYLPSSEPPGTANSIPVECESTAPNPFNEIQTCDMMHGPRVDPVCLDAGWGLKNDGTLTQPRSETDLRILSTSAPLPLVDGCPGLETVHCRRGGLVGVTFACGNAPEGNGGQITPGVYVLTEFVRFTDEGYHYPTIGSYIWQTLYVTEASMLVASDDPNNFGDDGVFSYRVHANGVDFIPHCESQPPQYRAFPASATFLTYESTLELFDATGKVRLKFERIE